MEFHPDLKNDTAECVQESQDYNGNNPGQRQTDIGIFPEDCGRQRSCEPVGEKRCDKIGQGVDPERFREIRMAEGDESPCEPAAGTVQSGDFPEVAAQIFPGRNVVRRYCEYRKKENQ